MELEVGFELPTSNLELLIPSLPVIFWRENLQRKEAENEVEESAHNCSFGGGGIDFGGGCNDRGQLAVLAGSGGANVYADQNAEGHRGNGNPNSHSHWDPNSLSVGHADGDPDPDPSDPEPGDPLVVSAGRCLGLGDAYKVGWGELGDAQASPRSDGDSEPRGAGLHRGPDRGLGERHSDDGRQAERECRSGEYA